MEETADAALAGDDGDGVEEAAQTGLGGLAVVDAVGSLRFVVSDRRKELVVELASWVSRREGSCKLGTGNGALTGLTE